MKHKETCIFCDLIERNDDSTYWIVKGYYSCAFLPLPDSSLAPGHILVIPNAHWENIYDVEEIDLYETMKLVKEVGHKLRDSLGATGFVVLNANGIDAGQSVPHLHFHVVPCWDDDNVTFWPGKFSEHIVEGNVIDLLKGNHE